MSSQNLKSTQLIGPDNLELFAETLLSSVANAVRRASVRYRNPICLEEFDDLSQEIVLRLLEDDCRRLKSFKGQALFETWLQIVANRHISNYLQRRKQTEPLDEVNPDSLTYLPSQDEEIAAAEEQELLLKAFRKLNERELLLYQLCFVYELAPSKIAASFRTEMLVIYKRKQTLALKLGRLVRGIRTC
jgi:RNA polymerase sigma factor (sigma-70 family)